LVEAGTVTLLEGTICSHFILSLSYDTQTPNRLARYRFIFSLISRHSKEFFTRNGGNEKEFFRRIQKHSLHFWFTPESKSRAHNFVLGFKTLLIFFFDFFFFFFRQLVFAATTFKTITIEHSEAE